MTPRGGEVSPSSQQEILTSGDVSLPLVTQNSYFWLQLERTGDVKPNVFVCKGGCSMDLCQTSALLYKFFFNNLQDTKRRGNVYLSSYVAVVFDV